MNSVADAVPDLLRRFVPAPHSARITFGGDLWATVQTNDPQLLTAMQPTAAATCDNFAADPTICMTIIRDADAPAGGTDLTLLCAWPLATLFVGCGTVLTLDGESRNVVGFLAPSVTAAELMNHLLPMLLEPLRSKNGRRAATRLTEER